MPDLSSVIASDFDRIARLYEELRAPLSNSMSRRLVRFAKISPGQDVLDVGTGTGSAALAAARLVGESGSVVGIDISAGMMKIAREKAAASGLRNLRFEKMDASSLGFSDGSFDAVISNLGIPTHFFPRTVSEAFRVLRNRGTLCFSDFSRTSSDWASMSKVLARYSVEIAPPPLAARREARRQMVEMDARFPPSSYMGILRSAGFTGVRTILQRLTTAQSPSSVYLRYVMARERLEYGAMSEYSRNKFREELRGRLEAIRMRSGGRMTRFVKFWIARKQG